MDIEVKVDAEAVERAVTAAIVQSSIGKNLTAAVEKVMNEAMQDSGYGRNAGIIISVVQAEVRTMVKAVIEAEFADIMKAKIREAITDERIQSVVEKTVEQLFYGDNRR